MIVPSFYGNFADSASIQAYLDTNLQELYGRSIWRNYLDEGIPQASLTFETAIGRSRIEAAASIVDPDSRAPLRARAALEMLNGKIPTMKEQFRLNQADMRSLLSIQQNGAFNDNARVQALLRSLFDDVKKAAVAGDKRVDIMLLQGISTLTVDVSITNNPDGVAYGVVPLLARAYQRQGVPIVWSSASTAKPITDIYNFVTSTLAATGRSFSRILMSLEQWIIFSNTTEVQDRLKSFYNIGKTNGTYAPTLENVNMMMIANMWPPIEIVNYSAGIESDGVISAIRPFSTTSVVFVPDGKLGTLQNAFPLEMVKPVAGKSYSTFGPTLVAKWMVDEPLAEYTGMEMNAFPALNDIDSIYVLKTETQQNSFAYTDTSYITT